MESSEYSVSEGIKNMEVDTTKVSVNDKVEQMEEYINNNADDNNLERFSEDNHHNDNHCDDHNDNHGNTPSIHKDSNDNDNSVSDSACVDLTIGLCDDDDVIDVAVRSDE